MKNIKQVIDPEDGISALYTPHKRSPEQRDNGQGNGISPSCL